MIETLANAVTGFLLRGVDGAYFFRVYNRSVDPPTWNDYAIRAADIEVMVVYDDDNLLSLYTEPSNNPEGGAGIERNRLDHSSQVLGRKPQDRVAQPTTFTSWLGTQPGLREFRPELQTGWNAGWAAGWAAALTTQVKSPPEGKIESTRIFTPLQEDAAS